MDLLEQLKTACSTHDWYYSSSDDSRCYDKGWEESLKIDKLIHQCKEENLYVKAVEVYNQFSPWPLSFPLNS